jgi:hypothetical protein
MKSTDSRTFNRTDDRCDRCGAEAMYAAVHGDSELELLFCIHHFTANSSELIHQGFLFIKNPKAIAHTQGLTGVVS